MSKDTLKRAALRESALFFGLLFFGFVIAPIVIFLIGQRTLGEFGGYGYSDFFGSLSARIRQGDPLAWFFVLSPYLAWQVLRFSLFAWRKL